MKIICIGRNYANHAKELGNPLPKEPLIFMKPDTALLRENRPFYYPSFSNDIHYEVELIIKISKIGKNIQQKFAHKYYDTISLGIDFTARDLQQKCKEKGHPWERAKAFDSSALIGAFKKKEDYKNLNDLNFSLKKNGEIVQIGNTNDMIFKIDELISYISQFYTLKIGDLIYTGTPEGVGPVILGDRLEGFIEDEKIFHTTIK